MTQLSRLLVSFGITGFFGSVPITLAKFQRSTFQSSQAIALIINSSSRNQQQRSFTSSRWLLQSQNNTKKGNNNNEDDFNRQNSYHINQKNTRHRNTTLLAKNTSKKNTTNTRMNFFDKVEHEQRQQQSASVAVNNNTNTATGSADAQGSPQHHHHHHGHTHHKGNHHHHHSNRRTVKKKGVLYDTDSGEVLECLFCKIHTREEPGRIEYEDEKYVVFHTTDPATHRHLLVTPRQHITSIRSLKGQEGATLVKELIEIGKKALTEEYVKNAKFCFHIPPYTSIDHIHLHAIADHHTAGWWASMKYPSRNTMYCRNAFDLIKELEDEEKTTSTPI